MAGCGGSEKEMLENAIDKIREAKESNATILELNGYQITGLRPLKGMENLSLAATRSPISHRWRG